MENVYQKAFENALSSESLQKTIAKAVLKEVISLKMNPANAEDDMVIKHVTFADNDESGEFMTAGDISARLNEIDSSVDLRVRVLGKTLAAHCLATVADSAGRKYKILNIGSKPIPVTENEPDQDVDKVNEIPKVEPEDAFEPAETEAKTFESKLSEFDNLDQMEDHLDDLEHEQLTAFVSDLGLNIETNERDDIDIVEDIMREAKAIIEGKAAAIGEVDEVQEQEDQPKKKDKKKSKKDKKKKKKSKKDKNKSEE